MSAHNIGTELHDAQTEIPDPGPSGTISIDRNCIVNMASATAEARTLALPSKEGVEIALHMITDGGDITLTVASAFNETGDTTITFTDVGQFATFKSFMTSDGVYFWRLTSHWAIGNMSPTEAGILDGLTATAAEINARAASASRRVNVTDAATYSILAANSGKIHIMPDFTASCTLALPAVADGLEYTFISKAVAADAQNWIFQSASATNFFLGGVSFADTDAGAGADEIHAGIWSNGSSNDFFTVVTPGAGTRVHIFCDGTNWIVNGQVFSATVPAFSDT